MTEIQAAPRAGAAAGVARRLRPAGWPAWQVDLLLALVALIWGGTFLLVQTSVRVTGPFTFLALRFGLAALALACVFLRRLRRLRRGEVAGGAVIGIFLFGGYATQTLALQLTTSSKTGFLTGLNVVLVPLLALLVLHQRPGGRALAGVALATAGLFCLALGDRLDLQAGPGEVLAFLCAVCFAGQVVLVSRFAPAADAINLAFVQIAVTALLSAAVAPWSGEPLILPPAPVLAAATFLGLVATAFALVVVNGVQQFTSSTRAALIYALEPVFAGLFGYLAGESLSAPAWLGCGLIFAGMVTPALHPRTWWTRRTHRRR